MDPQPRVAASHLKGPAVRYSSLAHGPCPDPRLQDVQVHFPRPETGSDGPGEVRLHRTEHGAIVMALGPDAVKRPTFPPSPAELAVILENGSIGAPGTIFCPSKVSRHPPFPGSWPLPLGPPGPPPDTFPVGGRPSRVAARRARFSRTRVSAGPRSSSRLAPGGRRHDGSLARARAHIKPRRGEGVYRGGGAGGTTDIYLCGTRWFDAHGSSSDSRPDP